MVGQPKKIVIRITDRSDIFSAVYHESYTKNQTNNAILAEKKFFDAILLKSMPLSKYKSNFPTLPGWECLKQLLIFKIRYGHRNILLAWPFFLSA